MATLEEKAEAERLRTRLGETLNRVPPHSSWSHGRTLDYKKAHAAAKKAYEKTSPKPGEISSHINTMIGFFT